MEDRFFEKRAARGKRSHAELRFSRLLYGDACVFRIDGNLPELVVGHDEVEDATRSWIAMLEQQGYQPATGPTLPGLQTPAVIEAITGHRVPARYAAFLEQGPHPRGIVDGIPGFADQIPIVFDDPVVPFWLAHFGHTDQAPNAIPIAIVEEGRVLSIDATTGAIHVYDNSASRPHVRVCKDLDALLAKVTFPAPRASVKRTSKARRGRAR